VLFKHIEDDGDLSLFILDNGDVGVVCQHGHRWLLSARPAGAAQVAGARPANDVFTAIEAMYPGQSGNS
jgi:hypothetical protein